MVYLVGAGPGDPELLTLKGRRALEKASVVLYDNLAPEQVLAFAPPGALRVYVGKKRSRHAYSQEEICAMLIDHARSGKTVVRLKGGDPYLFGRGGEEAEALFAAGIPFQVIPGVTAAAGIAAYSGVPLTHRAHASAVSIVTGHDADAMDWSRFSNSDTLVILMGLTNFAEIARRLIACGRPPDTPALAVRWGTRPDQETLGGTLETLPGLVESRGMKPPATFFVGEVARLQQHLNWFERLPLFGQRIVITRPREQAAGLAEMLRDLGAADRVSGDPDRSRKRLRPARSRHRNTGRLRLARLHQRKRRPRILRKTRFVPARPSRTPRQTRRHRSRNTGGSRTRSPQGRRGRG